MTESKSVKNRFTTPDVKAMVRDIRGSSVMGIRIANIYDLSDKTYLFKFAIPGQSDKVFLMLESGTRFHTTKYTRDIPDLPSPFTMKLRKYLRTKRLEDVRQLGQDRVIDFKYGSGDTINHVILELYANGNIILTDSNYVVISLLRSHQFETDVTLKVDEVYPIAFSTNISSALSSSVKVAEMSPEGFLAWSASKLRESEQREVLFAAPSMPVPAGSEPKGGSKKKKSKQLNVRQLLLSQDSGVSVSGPDIIEHCILKAGLKPSLKVEQLVLLDSSAISLLIQELAKSISLVQQLDIPGQSGFIICKTMESKGTEIPYKEYLEFTPLLLFQHENRENIEYPSFDAAVDEFFGKVEDQKLQRQASSAEEAARKKIDKVKGEQEKILATLANQQKRMEKSAMLLELYASEVDKVSMVLNSAVGSGMTWLEIEEMVATEKSSGNPIAALVGKLRLDRNHVVLFLKDPDVKQFDDGCLSAKDDTDSDSENDSEKDEKLKHINISKSKSVLQDFLEVEIDLSLSAYANARNMYSHKKVAKTKELKTLSSSIDVIKAVEQQTMKALESQNLKRTLLSARKVHWFEKFNWFISTEGYLILSGRDAQQNDTLYKKYLRASDIYVHADISGASSCIVRAKLQQTANSISPLAIQEAGIMAVCRSSAWTNKVITSAWWVLASQVSKSAPTGEFLTTGSFMIYGKKNFLPPLALEMGFGIAFKLDDSSVSRHLGDRKDRDYLSDVESISAYTDNLERYNIDFPQFDLDKDSLEKPQPENGGTKEELKIIEISQTNISQLKATSKQTPKLNKISTNSATMNLMLRVSNPSKKDEQIDNAAATIKYLEEKEKKLISSTSSSSLSKKPTTKLGKKKARRYAEQDDEDRELAMLVLGHSKDGEKLKDKMAKIANENKKVDVKKQQDKLGIKFVKEEWPILMGLLHPEVADIINNIILDGLLKESEIDAFEIRCLASFSSVQGVAILNLFREGKNLLKVGNKSGFLAGIMRRFTKDETMPVMVDSDKVVPEENSIEEETDVISRRERKKIDKQQVFEIIDQEGIMDEEEGKQADEIEKITGCPVAEDKLLYAIPICAPYSSLQNFKYKVKLTPGTAKKGKTAKQAVELFTYSKECNATEKALIKGLQDTEMVATMIGDVKLSMPGLHQQQLHKKKIKGKK